MPDISASILCSGWYFVHTPSYSPTATKRSLPIVQVVVKPDTTKLYPWKHTFIYFQRHSIEKLLNNRRLPTTYPCIPFIPNYSKGTDCQSIAPHLEKGAKFLASTIPTKLLGEHHESLQQKWKLFQRTRWKLVVNKRVSIVSPSSLQSEHKSEKAFQACAQTSSSYIIQPRHLTQTAKCQLTITPSLLEGLAWFWFLHLSTPCLLVSSF